MFSVQFYWLVVMFTRNLVFSLNGLLFVLCATLIFSLMQQFIVTAAYPPLEKNKTKNMHFGWGEPLASSDELIEQLLHKTGNQTSLSVSALSPILSSVFFWPAGLPHGFDDVRGGSLRGEWAPHLQREHPGDKGHRGIPQTGGAEVSAGRPRWVNGDPGEAREKKEQLLRLRIFPFVCETLAWSRVSFLLLQCSPKVRSSVCQSSALRHSVCNIRSGGSVHKHCTSFLLRVGHFVCKLPDTCLRRFFGLFVRLYANYATLFFPHPRTFLSGLF